MESSDIRVEEIADAFLLVFAIQRCHHLVYSVGVQLIESEWLLVEQGKQDARDANV